MNDLWRNGKLRLIIAGACNLACFYCHNEGQEKHNSLMGMDLVGEIEELARDSLGNLREVTISGGEPLLHPRVDTIIARFVALNVKVTMVTNAVLLDDQKIRSLKAAGLSKVRIGLDSLKQGKPRPSPGYLPDANSVPATVDAVLAAGLPVEINTVVTKNNRDELTALIRFAVSRGLSIKFFEHVEVVEYGAVASTGLMRAKPHISFEEFKALLSDDGMDLSFEPSRDNGPANEVARIGAGTLRYCRYLCQFGLCWTTGTRVDAMRYVYSCMVNRGLDQLASEHRDAMIRTIEVAAHRDCRSVALASHA